ncbi:hypothetical protein EXM65_12575 [Clostridium botulinum]|uniref:Uncharacterized protein n=1 Tax=Clostridium botulinum TaxID=1491 RepID=A0A6M0SPW8_CLOBO|nr:hypothetical protein [Clostridium botulinum]NFO35128.1 hypothetical protein [Clostridium botulinum]NFO48394.1 hypothetical protein [Clostridium botulinum]NFO58635.1 hypothetical protein [Clostridium botulinum]
MIFDINDNDKPIDVNVGDILVADDGNCFLIIFDYDHCDYRAINLTVNQCSDYCRSLNYIENEIKDKWDCNIVRVISGDKIKLMEIDGVA